jgi:hypothetical protein
MTPTHVLIRIKDGVSFRNSKNPVWGMNRGGLGLAKKMKEGDIIWFHVNKTNGAKAIAVAEYTGQLYDRKTEPLMRIHTLTNEEQGWVDKDERDIQIHYKNLYMIEHADVNICFRGQWGIQWYTSVKNKIDDDLPVCFENIKRFCVPLFTSPRRPPLIPRSPSPPLIPRSPSPRVARREVRVAQEEPGRATGHAAKVHHWCLPSWDPPSPAALGEHLRRVALVRAQAASRRTARVVRAARKREREVRVAQEELLRLRRAGMRHVFYNGLGPFVRPL